MLPTFIADMAYAMSRWTLNSTRLLILLYLSLSTETELSLWVFLYVVLF